MSIALTNFATQLWSSSTPTPAQALDPFANQAIANGWTFARGVGSANVLTANSNQTGTTITAATGTVQSVRDRKVYILKLTSGALPGGVTNGGYYHVKYVSGTTFNLRNGNQTFTGTADISLTAATGTFTLTEVGLHYTTGQGRNPNYGANQQSNFTNHYLSAYQFDATTDLSGGYFYDYISTAVADSTDGLSGVYYALVDSSNRFAIWRLDPGSVAARTTEIFLQPTRTPWYAVSGFDLTHVVGGRWMYGSTGNGGGENQDIGVPYKIFPTPNITDNAAPLTLDAIVAALQATFGITKQLGVGAKIYRLGHPLRIGDGTVATTFADENATITFANVAADVMDSDGNYFNFADISFGAVMSASDDFTLKNTQIKYPNAYTLDFSGTPAASELTGNTVIGATTANAGPVPTGSSFINGSVTQNGRTFTNCNFSNSPLTCDDPDIVTGCAFTSGGTGHAITITATCTCPFSNNSFTGYGADGTTDAAIYNNSGGLVTLKIVGGNQVPTVRNGAGASTSIVVSCTFTDIPAAGSSPVLSLEELDGSGNPLGSPVFLRPTIVAGTATVDLKPNTKYAYIADALGYYPSKRLILDTAIASTAAIQIDEIVDALGNPRYGNGIAGEMALISYDVGDDDIHITYSGTYPVISFDSFLDATELIYTTHDFIESGVLKPTYGDGDVIWPSTATTKIADQTGNTGTPELNFFPHKIGESTAYSMIRSPYYTVYGLRFPSTAFVVNGGFTEAAAAAIAADIASIPADILATTYEGSETVRDHLRIARAALAGKTSGGGTVQETFYGLDGTTPRIINDNDGKDRTSVTVSGA